MKNRTTHSPKHKHKHNSHTKKQQTENNKIRVCLERDIPITAKGELLDIERVLWCHYLSTYATLKYLIGQKQRDVKDIKDITKHVYDRYIDEDSKQEINISYGLRQEIHSKIKAFRDIPDENYTLATYQQLSTVFDDGMVCHTFKKTNIFFLVFLLLL